MADPFVAEIRIFPFNFAPRGWAWCDGQLLPLSQNTALFSLLGTTYGGNGKSNFALPDLQGSAPMHPGQGPGIVAARLGRDRRKRDRDATRIRDPGSQPCPAGRPDVGDIFAPEAVASLAVSTGAAAYQQSTANLVQLAPRGPPPAGGDQPHNNLQPYLTFYFNIALQGVFPPRG